MGFPLLDLSLLLLLFISFRPESCRLDHRCACPALHNYFFGVFFRLFTRLMLLRSLRRLLILLLWLDLF